MLTAILSSKILIAILSGIGGTIITIFTNQLLNRRSRFRYSVSHVRVGVSTDDTIFGSVKVTWNDNEIANLFLSTIELVNDSMRDFENVEVKAFSNNTDLLTERTEILGTTQVLKWTDEYTKTLQVPPNQQALQSQLNTILGERVYLIPTINRGQIVRLSFLNAAKTDQQPAIWLEIQHKGIKLEFGVAHTQFLGVPQPTAGWVGLILGLFFIGIVIFSPILFG